jgi:hypothetical protein
MPSAASGSTPLTGTGFSFGGVHSIQVGQYYEMETVPG